MKSLEDIRTQMLEMGWPGGNRYGTLLLALIEVTRKLR